MWWHVLVGCDPLLLDPPEPAAWVVYDPASGAIPTPNDLARDADAGRLALPIDDTQSPAEQRLRAALNEQDGWSSTAGITFALSSPVAPESVDEANVQIWEWSLTPTPVTGLAVTLAEDGLTVEIEPPTTGWKQGGRY